MQASKKCEESETGERIHIDYVFYGAEATVDLKLLQNTYLIARILNTLQSATTPRNRYYKLGHNSPSEAYLDTRGFRMRRGNNFTVRNFIVSTAT